MRISKQDLEGLGAIYATFEIREVEGKKTLGEKDIGCAVTITGNFEVGLTFEGSTFLGKLVDINNEGDLVTIQVSGIMSLPTDDLITKFGCSVVGAKGGKVMETLDDSDLVGCGYVIAVRAGECTLLI